MSEVPPVGEPTPPQQSDDSRFVAYHRGGPAAYGSPEKLQALADGYFGLNIVFVLNVVLAFGARFILAAQQDERAVLVAALAILIGMLVIIAAATLPCNKKIGYGKGWPDSTPRIASFLMGLNSALCCGIIGYIVMQNIALNEMKRYGIRAGSFLGLRKKDVEAHIAAMKSMPAPPPGFQA